MQGLGVIKDELKISEFVRGRLLLLAQVFLIRRRVMKFQDGLLLEFIIKSDFCQPDVNKSKLEKPLGIPITPPFFSFFNSITDIVYEKRDNVLLLKIKTNLNQEFIFNGDTKNLLDIIIENLKKKIIILMKQLSTWLNIQKGILN